MVVGGSVGVGWCRRRRGRLGGGRDCCGVAVVDVGGGVQADAGVAVSVVVVVEERRRRSCGRAAMLVKRFGNVGEYLRVLNWASL